MHPTNSLISVERIAHAAEIIEPYVRRTPVIEVLGADFGLEVQRLVLKLELLQVSGSFKARGAFANLLLRDLPPAGVAAASGGNHGAAVAYAAMRLGVPAKIFVPDISPEAKRERIRACGAELVVIGERYVEALAACEAWAARSGALQIHAYDQPETLLGQGTLGREFQQQAPNLDSLLVAVGGGGLIGGIAAWYRGSVRLIGVEPIAAPSLHKALAAGEPVDTEVGGIAADSLGARRVGSLMYPLARRHVETVALVSDDAIRRAQRVLWESLRVAAEPGGAAALAAVLSGAYLPRPDERVGVMVCGGNMDGISFTSA